MAFRHQIGTALLFLAKAGHKILRSPEKIRRLSLGDISTRFFLAALSVLVLPHCGLAEDSVCPIPESLSPASHSDALVVPEYTSGRPLIANDYIVIEYNAQHDKGSWSDYHHVLDGRDLEHRTYPIITLDSFLPVFYTKEKIAVRVCGFHFTDVVGVTATVNGAPEGVADIRGATPVTPPAALSTTFDTLQSGVPTGGTTMLPGLGLGAPPALPSLSISGITLGTLGVEDQTPGKYPSYTPATVSASGKQVALLLYSVTRNVKEVSRLIDRTMGEPYPSEENTEGEATEEKILHEATQFLNIPDEATKQKILNEAKSAPGSVNGVNYILDLVLGQVKKDDSNLSDSVAFDRDLIDAQNVNAQISTLASALSSQAYASNALALLSNYSVLTGILDLAKLGVNRTNCQGMQPTLQPGKLGPDDLKKIDFDTIGNLSVTQVSALKDSDIALIPHDKKDLRGKTVQDRVRALATALKALGVGGVSPVGDQPLCSAFEKQKLTDFWDSYSAQIKLLIGESKPENLKCMGKYENTEIEFYGTTPDGFEGFAGCELAQLNAQIDKLRDALKSIDLRTTELYDRMNEWNRISSIEHTDKLAPVTQNSDVRISIMVQRGYTPFTLANASGTITPAVTANTVPLTPGTASTSTPAHSARVIQIQMHRLANFNLVGGAMLIHIPTTSYGVQASPTYALASSSSPTGYTGTCGGQTVPVPVSATQSSSNPVSYSCIVQTQQTQWQVAGMAGLGWFPLGHDYYPRRLGYANFGRNLLPSLLLATSVTSLGNAMGGVNWEPIGGLDFYAGIASGHKTVLPSGLSVNTAAVPGTTVTPVTQEHVGLAIGVGMDLNSIIALFNFKGSQAALP
jgi:hypothetical protein